MSNTPRPLKDQVLVKQDPQDLKTPSGLHIPELRYDDPKAWSAFGTVLAIGPNVTDVKVGDRVTFKRRGGTALDPNARAGLGSKPSDPFVDLLMLRCPSTEREYDQAKGGDILGVVEDETP